MFSGARPAHTRACTNQCSHVRRGFAQRLRFWAHACYERRCQPCPFIVRLFGFVDDGGPSVRYVMEWAEGGDLGTLLESLKARRRAGLMGAAARLLMAEASVRYYVGCLLLALEFLHGNGMLHRDVKPSNMLLMSDGTAKLADLVGGCTSTRSVAALPACLTCMQALEPWATCHLVL